MKRLTIILAIISSTILFSFAQKVDLQPYVILVQPIVVQSDEGTEPASMALPEDLVDRAYEKAEIDFHFLEPIYYNNTKARDGLINLDMIVKDAYKAGLIKGQDDIVNMFFINAVDGHKGPLGRGMMGGNITFIALGDHQEKVQEDLSYMQAFVIAHEVGHNLSLEHAVDDVNVPNDVPNIQGDGAFKDRVDPKYALNAYQIEEIKKSPLVHSRISFLSRNIASKAILDESFEPYFSKLQALEIAAFLGEEVSDKPIEALRSYAKQKFSSAVLDFSEEEQACITYVVNRINQALYQNNMSLMALQPWRFIKVADWLCGGFAHTRGSYIILSQRHLDYLSQGWNENMSEAEKTELVKRLGALLVHEQLHTLQRAYPSRFYRLYTEDWGFVKAEVVAEQAITDLQVSNPDAPIANWLIRKPGGNSKGNPQKNEQYYWPRTLLKKTVKKPVMGKDFTDKAFAVVLKDGQYRVKKDARGQVVSVPLLDLGFYANAFPVTRGLDHPNEISAYMFANYFIALIDGTKAFKDIRPESKANTEAFLRWIEQEMKL